MAVTLWKWQIYIYREKVACSHHNNSKNYQANSNLSRKHHKIEATSQTSRGFLCALKVYLFFLTSTAFVDTNAEYGIPLSRYTVFLQNCPLENSSKGLPLFSYGKTGQFSASASNFSLKTLIKSFLYARHFPHQQKYRRRKQAPASYKSLFPGI